MASGCARQSTRISAEFGAADEFSQYFSLAHSVALAVMAYSPSDRLADASSSRVAVQPPTC